MICTYLKPKIFQENSQIFEAGRPLHSMIYIVSGYVRISDPREAPSQIETLEKGTFVGEQLLEWATRTKTFTDQPDSEKTVRCPTKVEAFVLSVEDLKTLASKGILPKNSAGEA
ncbi:cyclic nucleotide-gated ion channel 1-like [Prunus yedoensis var. nudiflora]|uniref:Cyclic nucleotide-gated ion channel 1-like n=1 Tax=Prunus yedoensis var. nudiflora TaxID=2094558 RepID=A0A314U5H1_PRUYE|nr:cyclic nucleotide-gated ion channel 1-like [Prunus yedoensis var. nudiflora]